MISSEIEPQSTVLSYVTAVNNALIDGATPLN